MYINGQLFKNENKKDENSSDYYGTIRLFGTDFWLNGKVKTSKSGKQYIWVYIGDEKKPRDEQGQSSQSAGNPPPQQPEDDLPF